MKTLAERNPALFENIKIPGIEALNASVSATGVPSLYKAWMEHLVRPNMVFEKALKRKKGEIDDMDTKLITTDTSNIDIANGLDPSIIFATVGNANDGMTCMDINKDITQVVTGHSDCIVRVWRMDTTNADLAEGQNNSNMPFGSLLREKGCNDHWEMDDIRPKPLKAFERQNNGNKDKNQSFGKGKFPMLEFVGHDLPVYSVHQSHFLNSRLVVSTSADQTIRLWDTGKYFLTY